MNTLTSAPSVLTRSLSIALGLSLGASALLLTGCVVAERPPRRVVVAAPPPPPPPPVVVERRPGPDVVVVERRGPPPPPNVIIVRTPPPPPRVDVRPARPSHRHIWVEGHWRYQGGNYVWIPGHWEAPPRAHAVYIQPHWERRSEGPIPQEVAEILTDEQETIWLVHQALAPHFHGRPGGPGHDGRN